MKRCPQFYVISLGFFYSNSVMAGVTPAVSGNFLFACLILAGLSLAMALLVIYWKKLTLLTTKMISPAAITIRKPLSANNKFLSIVSHELRTPMNGILGSLHMLDREGLKEEQALCLQQVKVSAQEMMYLVSELLDYSAMQAEAIQLHETSVNLRDSLSHLFQRVEIKCEAKKIKFNGSITRDVPCYVWLDGKKFMTVLEHLLDNAWKYTAEGSIDCVVSMNGTNQLIVQVSDTGVGIDHQHRAEIFKPFKQVENYAERSAGGLGLGLSICYAFAKTLKGKVSYLVSPARGSNFLFTLPIGSTTMGEMIHSECSKFDVEIPPEKTTELKVTPSSLNLTPRKSEKAREEIRILIVDDNATNCFVAKGMVKKLGFQSETAFTGELALNFLKEREFDLVLMDCQMPVMDGFQATMNLRQLTHSNSQIPVIAVTANTLPNDRKMCLDHGMNDYMTKPINMALLEEKISYWLSLGEKQVSDSMSEKAEDKKIIDWAKYKK